MFFSFAISIILILCITSYQEITRKLYFVTFTHQIRERTICYPLNYENEKKFAILLNLLTKLVFKYLLILSIIISESFIILTTFLAYIEPGSNFKIITMIFWVISILVFFIQCFGVLWFGFVQWFGISFYLVLKFKEVFEKIQLITRNTKNVLNGNRILKAIEEHNYVRKLTEEMNHFFRLITLIIYLIATPGFLICLYVSQHRDTTRITSFFTFGIFITCFAPVILMNLMSSKIDQAAKRPMALLYRYFSRPNNFLYLKKRLKIFAFMEHLIGADIGFSCYNLFHMDMLAFYQYIYVCGIHYLLLYDLF